MKIKEIILNLSKKQKQQILIGSSIALLLIGSGVTASVVSKNNAEKVQQVKQAKMNAQKKIEEKAKTENDAQVAATKALATADKSNTDENIKAAEKAISKVKDEVVLKKLTGQLNVIKSRQGLENTAKKAVSEYQKDATNNDKLTNAQNSVNKLSDKQSKELKDQLSKQISDSKSQAEKAKAAEDAKKASESQKSEQSTNSETTQNTSNTAETVSANQNTAVSGNDYVAPSVADTTNSQQNNQSQPVTPTPEPTPTPQPPAHTYTGWVRNEQGAIIWSQGGFGSLSEAGAAAAIWLNSHIPEAYSCGAF